MKPVIVLTGATGSGKSAFLYQHLQGQPLEVIGADARQIYRYMKIGTAMPSKDQLEMFPHHLFHFLEPSQKFSAGEFVKKTKALIPEIHQRKKIPIIIGGTFFYIKSLWDGLSQEPSISNEIKNYVESLTIAETRLQLKEKDVVSFQKISASDKYRLSRALMVSLSGEKPFSAYTLEGGIYHDYYFYSCYLQKPRKQLYADINLRTQNMFEEGLLDEVKELLKQGFNLKTAGIKSIGYKEIFERITHLAKNDWAQEDYQTTMIEILQNLSQIEINQIKDDIAQKTRNYAKRQLTWFRNEPRLSPLTIEEQNIFLKKLEDLKNEFL